MMLYAKVVTIRDAQVTAAPPPRHPCLRPPLLPATPPSLPRHPALPSTRHPSSGCSPPDAPRSAPARHREASPNPYPNPPPFLPLLPQCTEKKVIEKERQEEERRLDTIMEIERLKALQMYAEREKKQSQARP